jgi:hypothetical protein
MSIGSAAFEGLQRAAPRSSRASRRRYRLQVRVAIWLISGVVAWCGVAGMALSVAALARGLAGQA